MIEEQEDGLYLGYAFVLPFFALILWMGYSALRVYFSLTTTLLILILIITPVALWLKLSSKKEKTRPDYIVNAARAGDIETVRTLINRGADVNVNGVLGMTALMFASGDGRVDLVKLLLKAGAEVNARNNEGATALMFAMSEQQVESIRLLLNANADVSIKSNDGSTALDDLGNCNSEIIALLNGYKSIKQKPDKQ